MALSPSALDPGFHCVRTRWIRGREMGHAALEAYTEVKAVTTQL
jgi:hypothetical protein